MLRKGVYFKLRDIALPNCSSMFPRGSMCRNSRDCEPRPDRMPVPWCGQFGIYSTFFGLMEWLLPSLRGWPQTSGLVSRGIRGSSEGVEWAARAPYARRRINRRRSRGRRRQKEERNQGKLVVHAGRSAWNGIRRGRSCPKRIAGSSRTTYGATDRMVGFGKTMSRQRTNVSSWD